MDFNSWIFILWKSRGRNVRRKLTRDVFLLMAFAVSLITIIAIWQFRQFRNGVLEESTWKTLGTASNEFERLATDLESSLHLFKDLLGDSSLSSSQVKQMAEVMLRNRKELNAIKVFDSSTDSIYSAFRNSNGVIEYKAFAATPTQRTSMSSQKEGQRWSKAYISDITYQPVISRYVTTAAKDIQLGIDINVLSLHNALENMNIMEHGEVFLFRLDSAQVFIPNNFIDTTHNDINYDIFQPYSEVSSPALLAAFTALVKVKDGNYFPLIFEYDDQVYWMRAKPLIGSKLLLHVGVIIPESDFGELLNKRLGYALVLLAFGLFILGIGLVWVLSKYNNQIKELPQLHLDKKQGEKQLLELIQKGESIHLEFKSTVRYHLKAERNDKAIEFAWLKGVAGFLNTEGGILLLGVTDEGGIYGIEKDGFENEDKCLLHVKNLISRYLGVSTLKNIHYQVLNIEGQQVVVIEVEPANSPVYLSANNEDQFFIRTGPASTKLSVSETVDYVQRNFA